MNLILLGMPGAGKGTQATLIKEIFMIPHISTGDIFREAMINNTDLGKIAKGYVDNGELVPDKIVTDMVKERLEREDCKKGFILDGYPRTVVQAQALDVILQGWNKKITAVLQFMLSKEEALKRLSARRTCKNCSAVYNLLNKLPKVDGICDHCGAELYQRDDDKDGVILNRLKVYELQTAPLLEYYQNNGNLLEINANAPIQEIRDYLFELLKDKVTL